MDFSNRELTLIGEVRRLLGTYRRGLLTPAELASGLLNRAALADADRVIPHCLALLPEGARPHVEACIDRLAESDFQADLVFHLGPGPPEDERARLRLRNRAVAERVAEYYRGAGDWDTPPAGLEVPEVDLFWERLRGMRPDEGSMCQAPGCGRPALRVSVFCARHHYEQIERRPPPDD